MLVYCFTEATEVLGSYSHCLGMLRGITILTGYEIVLVVPGTHLVSVGSRLYYKVTCYLVIIGYVLIRYRVINHFILQLGTRCRLNKYQIQTQHVQCITAIFKVYTFCTPMYTTHLLLFLLIYIYICMHSVKYLFFQSHLCVLRWWLDLHFIFVKEDQFIQSTSSVFT